MILRKSNFTNIKAMRFYDFTAENLTQEEIRRWEKNGATNGKKCDMIVASKKETETKPGAKSQAAFPFFA